MKKDNDRIVRWTMSIIAALVLFVLSESYIKTINSRDDEQFALVAVIIILGGIYIGRWLGEFWHYEGRPTPPWLFILLLAVIIGCLFPCALFATSLLTHPVFMYALFLAIPCFILSVALGMLIKLTRLTISGQLTAARTAAANSDSELRLLQSQLSPHFLFNTLNNLYGISISHHERVPQLLLKLSELLRYSVYDTRELLVPLRDELRYINNYIDFEKIRVGERLALTTDFDDITDSGIRIAPMLLIVFVENAFKHSKNTVDGKIFIDIAMKISAGEILFSIKNSYGESHNLSAYDNSSGMGLANVRKRLELIYPQQYDFSISKKEFVHYVVLRIKLSN